MTDAEPVPARRGGQDPLEPPNAFASVSIDGDVPSPRSTPAIAAVGSQIFLFGGARDDYRSRTVALYDTTHAFDVDTCTFTDLAPGGAIPAPRAFAAAAADDVRGHFFVFGGASFSHGFADLAMFGELHRYDPTGNRWSVAALSEAGPGPRVRPNMWGHDGAIWLFGGLGADFVCHSDLWRFDLEREQWELVVADRDHAIAGRHEGVSTNTTDAGVALVVGGESVAADFSAERTPGVLEVDLDAGVVRSVVVEGPDLPGGTRNQGAAGVVGHDLYLVGGDDPSFEVRGCGAPYGQSPTGQVWRFDMRAKTWTLASTHGPALKRTAAATVNDAVYLFAGWGFECGPEGGPGQIWNDAVFAYSPSS